MKTTHINNALRKSIALAVVMLMSFTQVFAAESSVMATQGEPDPSTLTLSDTSYKPSDWANTLIGTSAAWNHKDTSGVYDMRGDGVTVAVIDSGVAAHSDLNGANFPAVDEKFTGATQWHGTFVAGIIAAQLNGRDSDGIAPNAKILSICVTDGEGNTSSTQVVEAIDYAVSCGAAVINLSMAGRNDNQALKEACERAEQAGVIIVACVGNKLANEDGHVVNYPAAYDSVISVSSCSKVNGSVGFSSFSCYNDTVDICAPGGSITSLSKDGGTMVKNGTSFASPVISAVAAIAKQKVPDMTKDDFVKLLAETADDMGEPGKDEHFGYGVVNVAKFVAALEKEYAGHEPSGDGTTDGAITDGSETGNTTSGGVKIVFKDVFSTDYYYDPVNWAVEKGITSGTHEDMFSPGMVCNRGQMVTFLYRMAGSPAYSGSKVKFKDLSETDYCYDAVQWAYKNGITTGKYPDTFGTTDNVTREQVVSFLARYAKYQDPSFTVSQDTSSASLTESFIDSEYVREYAVPYFNWALKSGLTTGTGGGYLSPRAPCPRGQIVTFLYRFDKMI